MGLYIDAESAFDYLLKRSDIDPSKIILFGRSLGGAVAINVASSPKYRDKLCALIVENTFTSIPDVAKVLFRIPILKWIPLWCHKNKYTNIRKIHRVKAPTLFLSGMRDELIPPRMMQLLFQTSISVMKRLAKFENGTHNETWQSEGYFETICQFIIEVTKSRHGPRLNSGHTVDSSVIIETNAFQDI
uniref:Alpha/beta hydrolase domain-containing protein 13-like n=1 Tax=Saccoglossus kowalevskii TaxID=10224 RepID=A0ABM0ML38_SACKO|nr:PREDICTED: alpha/beta hydrolase domain-containing protein 13-like [Saccoglossus kowalevskii]